MKLTNKILVLLFVILIVLSLVACDEDDVQMPTTIETVAETQAEVDYDNLVTDAYYKKVGDLEFAIPKINLDGSEIENINADIYEFYYEISNKSIQEIEEHEIPFTSNGVWYTWAINKDILSLVIYNDSHPNSSGSVVYEVYNVQISTTQKLSAKDIYTCAEYSEDEYFELIEQVMGSEFFENKESFIKEYGYQEMLVTQFERTIERANLEKAIPYFDSSGQICLVGDIYSIAGSEYYMHNMSVEDFEANDEYLKYMDMITSAEQGGFVEKYKAKLKSYPKEETSYYESSDGETKSYTNTITYKLYDVDKDGIPELFVKDSGKYDIYTYDGNDVVKCGEEYWMYDPCMYEYDENGVVIHEGGMGYLHLEYINLYTLKNNKFKNEKQIIGSETNTMEEVYDKLKEYSEVEGSYEIDDFEPIEKWAE